jgi:hypothetical protein
MTPGLEIDGGSAARGVDHVALHVRGVVLPDDEDRDLYIAGDRITLERLNVMKRGLPGGNLRLSPRERPPGGPVAMLYAGLDRSRQRLDVHLMNQHGEPVRVTTAPPDADGLQGLVRQTAALGGPVVAAIESMNGARFVHDQLELGGGEVQIADAQKVKGLAPLACKTDRIDAWVLAELARRDLVPAIWLPTPGVGPSGSGPVPAAPGAPSDRVEEPGACHPAGVRASLPSQRPVRPGGRQLLARLGLPQPWVGTTAAALELIDDLDQRVDACQGSCAGWAPTTGMCPCC